MIDSTAPEDGPVPSPPAPTPPAREFVAHAARIRGLVGSVFFGLILFRTFLSISFETAGAVDYVGLAFLGVMLLASIVMFFRPARISVGSKIVVRTGLLEFRSPIQNIRALTYDGSSLRLTFHDLMKVECVRVPGGNIDGARKTLESAFTRDEAHLVLPGFTLAQVDEMRSAAAMPPPSSDDPAGRVEAFHRALLVRSPRVYVTQALVAINIVVYFAMVIAGVNPVM